MRVTSLSISNLRAIERFEITDLGTFVLIAGPNGCGKSTVLDAVRLIKSLYVTDEWKRWFSEFNIDAERGLRFANIFRDVTKPATIVARCQLSTREASFLKEHADNIALGLVINELSQQKVPITGEPPLTHRGAIASNIEQYQEKAKDVAAQLRSELASGTDFVAAVRLTNNPPKLDLSASAVATATFSCFNPEALGEIEFHGSRRYYAREAVSTVRLNVGDRTEERRNRFLYDLENKYKNVKSQLSEEFVAAVLRHLDPNDAPLQRSIKELFRTFFPGKEFLGVTLGPDNSLAFPVRLHTGEVHDIDELSSGEKEIVYGYLWLRTGTPRQSVILVDEPELHLNPALVQGLPAFYKANLADALDAQVWIVTHSDAILRQAVRAPGMAVFHMARPRGDGSQQAIRIDTQSAVESAVLDLIGDLAAYRPYARIILVEGHKDTRFDVDVIRRLFPDLAERANVIPAGNRRMATGLRVRLLEILEESGLTGRAVSICDGDLGLGGATAEPGEFEWPVYEIENFLLQPTILRGAATVMLRDDPFESDDAVVQELRRLATSLVDELALAEVQWLLNGEFFSSIRIGGGMPQPSVGLIASTRTSRERINAVDIAPGRIEALITEASNKFRGYIQGEAFLERFPGDRLLRALAGTLGVSGDHYRNACLDVAQRAGVRPAGMEETLMRALA